MLGPEGSITKLQSATRTNSFATYSEYAQLINDQSQRQLTLRGLFAFKPQVPVPLEEVESAKEIVKRFVLGRSFAHALAARGSVHEQRGDFAAARAVAEQRSRKVVRAMRKIAPRDRLLRVNQRDKMLGRIAAVANHAPIVQIGQ